MMTSARSVTVWIDGIGAVGPGFGDWPTLRAQLAGEAPAVAARTVLPAPLSLPPAERRRAGPAIKASLACGLEAAAAGGRDPATLASVFTASGGDGDNCNAICIALAGPDPQDRLISPTRFHNSVHNAPSGYWSISTGATPTASVLCAHDGSFAAGLLEAATQCAIDGVPVLLVAYDADYPEPLRSVRPVSDTFGVALLLVPAVSPRSVARCMLGADSFASDTADILVDPVLEAVRATIPAARALPLLAAVAQGAARRVVLDYLDDTRLALTVAPA